MNYFVEGLQGSGKSTLVGRLSSLHPECVAIREGDYSPVELAWCAYLSENQYEQILERYADLRSEILEQTFTEGNRKIVCYTKIQTENQAFYQDMEQSAQSFHPSATSGTENWRGSFQRKSTGFDF